jgi:hypothetical protein
MGAKAGQNVTELPYLGSQMNQTYPTEYKQELSAQTDVTIHVEH